jgi:hypothetical protein
MDIFLLKYDSAGNLIWAKTAGEVANDWANGIASDTAGNIFITGFFQLDSVIFETQVLNNPGMFIVKYDSAGHVPWAISTPGAIGQSITSDTEGNLLVTGNIYGDSTLFGSTILINNSNPGSYYVLFVAKLSSSSIGINELSLAQNVIIIFPNPTNNMFNIKTFSPMEKTLVEIVNVFGERVYTEKLSGKNEYAVDANLTKGIYFVRVNDVVKKLVVE